jgi:hypothetical protein
MTLPELVLGPFGCATGSQSLFRLRFCGSCYQLDTKIYPISFSEGSVHIQTKQFGTIIVGFDVTDQLLIRLYAFVRYWEKRDLVRLWRYCIMLP